MQSKIILKVANTNKEKGTEEQIETPKKQKLVSTEFEKLPPVPKSLKLDKYASSEWRRITVELINENILKKLDLGALEILCKSYSRWRTLEEKLDELESLVYNPSVENEQYIQQRPEVSMAMNYAKQYKTICTEFGLTPASRHKILTEETPTGGGVVPNEKKKTQMQVILGG